MALPRGEIFVLVLVPSLLLINHSRDAPPALRRRLELYDGLTHVALPRIVGASGAHSSLRCRYERKALQWGMVPPSSSGQESCHGAAHRSAAGQPQRCPTCSIPLACSSQTANGPLSGRTRCAAAGMRPAAHVHQRLPFMFVVTSAAFISTVQVLQVYRDYPCAV